MEENLSEQIMSRFRRQVGPKPSIAYITSILNIANNVNHAAQIARPVPKEVLNKAQEGADSVAKAVELHQNKAKLSEILTHLKPGIDAITDVGHAIFNLGKDVHTKLENASAKFPGIYSDVMNTTLGVPQQHLDNFTAEANKGN